jgi:spore germination cell wall hydrolase CwlJ-like protein
MTSLLCLALNIYFEARGEDLDAQLLVAESVINRSIDRNQSICDVVYDDDQYSWTTDGRSDKPRDMEAFAVASSIAQQAIDGDHLHSGVTHYHEASIHPHWADDLKVLGRYGNHIFYY